MRYGWRTVLAGWMGALIGASVPVHGFAAPIEPKGATAVATSPVAGPSARMTVEVDWSAPVEHPPIAIDLSLNEGRLLGAVATPPASGVAAAANPDGSWRVGLAKSGRIRTRLEAPLGSTLTIKAGDQLVKIPLLRLLDAPQRTVPPAAIEVGAARVAWDVIEIDPGKMGGVAKPGDAVPVRVGFNVLSDASEVNLRFTAELRSVRTGVKVWEYDQKVVVATDTLEPPSWVLPVAAPTVEGLYSLEIRANWEPVVNPDGSSRLGRLFRRRRPGTAGVSGATRRMTFVVTDPKAKPRAEKPSTVAVEKVDSVSLASPHGYRPSASGRSPAGASGWTMPEAAIVEETRRDRLRGWATRASAPVTLPPADATGMAWTAVGLKVPHPDRPHRLTVAISGGHPSALGVGIVATGGPGGRPRVVLDACISGPPLIEGSHPQSYSWIVWPEAPEPVLVLVNRNTTSAVQPGSITLTELPDVPPGPAIVAPTAGDTRVVGLDLTGPSALDRFGGGGDPILATRNLARYLNHCGATAVVLPESIADRARRRALDGQAEEDCLGPDRLDLTLTLLARHGITAWLDLAPDAPLPGLPEPDSAEALAEGLVRVDRAGKADGPAYHPIHPKVREAMAARVAKAAEIHRSQPSLSGLLIRLGPGATLLGRPDTGLDDTSFSRFVAAMFDPGLARSIPGHGADDVGRFEARARFLEVKGQKPWLAWRSRELAAVYADLAESARLASPGMTLAVTTPDLDSGSVGDEIRRLDRVGLGPAQAWRSVGLDLTQWPSGASSPIVLRGLGLSADDLARDLATSRELDDQVAARPSRGLWLGSSSPVPHEPSTNLVLAAPPLPDSVAGAESLGHALAALDGRWFFAASDAVAGREERVRKFAQVVRSLPAPETGPTGPRPASGVSARLARSGGATFLALANDTPYPIQLELVLRCPDGASFVDIGQTTPVNAEIVNGGLRVVADLHPFGVASAKMDAIVSIESTATHPGAAVLDGMRAQYDDLSVTLARLNHLAAGDSGAGLANSDFEAPTIRLTSTNGPTTIEGWRHLGEKAEISLDLDRPHGGRSSLKLDATTLPASAISDAFAPAGHPSITIQAWLRADRPETKVRLWIEGQAAGRPFVRQVEVFPRDEWTATAARVSDIPPTGLESARLRFEMLTPGQLWLDDLAVSGPALSESERLNARRDLVAALSAYRDHRYADFARLAGSHWTRHVASEPAATGRLASDRSGLIRTGDASPNALPTSRRLR
jgi:hypothetical protein